MLHKKRTGKAFHVTKETVEKEAMYEEVDERYQEKRIRMLQAQNLQIEEQFHRHLLAVFAARANSHSTESSIASRRARNMTARASIDSGPHKMSLDLSNFRSSSSQGLGSLASTMATGDGYVPSPTTSFDPNAQSYIVCMNDVGPPYSSLVTPSTATTSGEIPAYMTHQISDPAWSTQVPAWAAMHEQQIPNSSQTPTETYAVQMWQQQMMQLAHIPSDNPI